MIILGIETSCDESAVSIIETRGKVESLECKVISSLIHSQADLHNQYGGVFPTLAKREHGKNLVPLLEKALIEYSHNKTDKINTQSISDDHFEKILREYESIIKDHDPDLWTSISHADFLKHTPHIDKIAVTEGPGLEPTLWVGINFARFLASLWQIPIVPINHMEGHIVASLLESDIVDGHFHKLKSLPLPTLALLISGGHTELVKINALGNYNIIGQTKDDAVGEAFDKVARILGLPYPGGPHISKLAEQAETENLEGVLKLPRPMIGSKDLDFSFSGLKTAVLYAVKDYINTHNEVDTEFKKSLCLEFERAVDETLSKKLIQAIEQNDIKSIIIGGGVIANKRMKKSFTRIANEYNIPIFIPSIHMSGDNALMIALAGILIGSEKNGIELRASGRKTLN
jgi:N6-L-threonylcarbamoyladenine synthase